MDGQLKSGRDVILMALLGAEEYAFGTAALITLGCVMMRKCSENTCPMGVATQDPKLRAHFRGNYEHVVNFFTFLAQEVREYLAEMGFKSLNEIVGRTDLLAPHLPEGEKSDAAEKWASLDFSRMLHQETGDYSIRNTNRAVGTMLSGYIEQKKAEKIEAALKAGKLTEEEFAANSSLDLGEASISVKFKGAAGQSFGAFLVKGVEFKLEGETNDYFAKGLSGGRISILPPIRSNFSAEDNIIAGNTGLYGATSGELYINGKVGERFGVRNSGAVAVVEGAGDHCCEYMTGGRVVVLGETGRNFAAGMSGGVAYVWDKNHNFDYFCNMDMVEINLVEESSYRKELHELIRQHYLYTGSKLARTMLDDWNRYVEDFIQVVPIEYKRVLQEEQVKKLQQKIADMQRNY